MAFPPAPPPGGSLFLASLGFAGPGLALVISLDSPEGWSHAVGLAGPGGPPALSPFGPLAPSVSPMPSPTLRVFCSGFELLLLNDGPRAHLESGLARPPDSGPAERGPRLPFGVAHSPCLGLPDLGYAEAPLLVSPPPSATARPTGGPLLLLPPTPPPVTCSLSLPPCGPAPCAATRRSVRLDKGARLCPLDMAKARKAHLKEGSTLAPYVASGSRAAGPRTAALSLIKRKGARCGISLSDDDVRCFRDFLEASS